MGVTRDTACEVQKSDNMTLVDILQLCMPQSPAAHCFAVFVHYWEQNWNKNLVLWPMGPSLIQICGTLWAHYYYRPLA